MIKSFSECVKRTLRGRSLKKNSGDIEISRDVIRLPTRYLEFSSSG
jgi:hypothetical protein